MALERKNIPFEAYKLQDKTTLQLGYLAIIIATLLYGGNIVAGRVVAPQVPPLALSAIRGILGILVLLPLALRLKDKPRLRDMPYMALLGFLGIGAAYTAFAIALKYTPAVNVAIIFASFPAVNLVLLAVGWRIKPTPPQAAGIIIAFTGLILVSVQGSLEHLLTLHFQTIDLVMLANVTSVALYNILGQKMMERYSPVTTSAYSLLFGTIFLAPGGLWEINRYGWHLPWSSWLLVLYMGCAVAGLAVFLNNAAVSRIGCGPVAIFNNLIPIYAIFLAAVLLRESILWYHMAGFALVLTGVVLSLRYTTKNAACTQKGTGT